MSHIRPADVSPFPITVSVTPTNPTIGNNISVTITMNQTVTSDTQVNIDTDHTSSLNPPSGQTSWPAHVTVHNGASAVTFTLTTNGIDAVNVKLGACPGSEDASNPANWTAQCTIAFQGQTPP